MGFQEEALKLFLTNNIEEAKKITLELNRFNSNRQEIEREIFNQAILELEKEDIDNLNSIVIGRENWHHRSNWYSSIKTNRKIL